MASPTEMPYVTLGDSGIKVSKLILGCANFGSPDWYNWVKDEQESISDIKAAYDMGINAFDTANVYSNGLSEVIVGKAIRTHDIPRKSVVIMTKLLNPVTRNIDEHFHGSRRAGADDAGYVNQHGLSRKHIFEAIDASLERLQMDYVDVLQCQGYDDQTPVSETMQALHDIVKAGKAHYIGMSTCRAWEFAEMQNYAIQNGLTKFISMQTNYNLLYREDERELLPMLQNLNVSGISWSALSRGALVLSLDSQAEQPDDRIFGGRQLWHGDIIDRTEQVAQSKRKSIAQVAMAWALARPAIHAVVLTAPSSVDHLAAAVDAFNIHLSPGDIAYLDEPYRPQRVIFPSHH